MPRKWFLAALILGACQDTSQSPAPRPERQAEQWESGTVQPLDLVYVCGNRFLVVNATLSSVHVTYSVVGTSESGGLTLSPGLNEDEGFSETPLETRESGAVELYHEGSPVARRRNGGTRCGPAAMSSSIGAASSSDGGDWAEPFSWPNVAIHLSLLPTGKVLSWGGYKTPHLWDPITESFTSVPSPLDVFCSGHAFLGDGSLLIAGGHIATDRGFPDITRFTPETESWNRVTSMVRGRWYPTNTTLGSGDVLIIGGRDEGSEWVYEPEVWTATGLRVLSNAPRRLPYYPRTFLAPDGRVFYAGEQLPSKWLDPSGSGRWSAGPQPLYPASRNYGGAVMYDDGKILYVGGGRTTNTAEIIDLNRPAPAWEWTGSMAFPRRHLNATVLPTGEVLVTGGTSGTGFNDFLQAVHQAEIWSPETGTWRTLAGNSIDRAYHSTSLLLPDGRVLHAGSGNGGGAPSEENAEIFSPPYLFRGARPKISDAPAAVGYGASFTVSTPDAEEIRRVSFIRLGSTTHAFDMNQRFQWLSFSAGAGSLTVSAPASRNRAPPGHYLLFILNGNGVPSVATIIRLGSSEEPEPPPPNTPPQADFTSSCTGFSCRFNDQSSDDGIIAGWEWDFGDGGVSTAANPTHTYAAAGTYEVTLRVTDDAAASSQRSSALTVTAPALITLTATGRADATRHYMTLSWAGATGPMVDIHRNGRLLKATANDGGDTNSRLYQGPATYVFKVCLTGTSTCSAEVTVSIAGITLTATGRTDATKHYMTLTWSGASGTSVDIYRNSRLLKTTANDGRDTNTRIYQGVATYVFKVCQAGSTVCSNEATVRLP